MAIFKICTFILIAMTATSALGFAAKIELVKDGISPYHIVLADDAIPAEKTAATQLQQYLHDITGATLPIINESTHASSQPAIWVGAGAHVQKRLTAVSWNNVNTETVIIKTQGNDLILAGGRPRGTLYAVYQFLEDQLHCRWWSPTEKDIPHTANITLPPLDITYTPPLEYRDFTRKRSIRYDLAYAESGVVLHSNGLNNINDASWGGRNNIKGFIHSFSSLIPPKKYFHDHPEWFADPSNNHQPATADSPMPQADKTQLCYSAPGLKEEIIKNARQWINDNPDMQYLSLSINDNRGYCRDAASMQLAEQEGSQSAPLLNFVNAISRELRKLKPNLKIITLAYYYTIKPPQTIRPDKNVYIMYAPIDANFGYPLYHDKNQKTREDLQAWTKITPNVIIWNYVGNFFYPLLPYPNWDSIGQDIKDLSRDGVKGIFDEAPWNSGDVQSDFPEMRAWIMGHLLWDPQKDVNELKSTFLEGYYGAAAPYLNEYIRKVQESYYRHSQKLPSFNTQFDFLDIDLMNEATQLFDRAENAVKDNATFRERVKRERLAIDFAWLHRYDTLKLQARGEHKPFLGPTNPEQFLTKVLLTIPDYAQKKYRFESTYNHVDFVERISYDFTPQEHLPDFLKNVPEEKRYVFEQGTFTLETWNKSVAFSSDEKASDGKALSILPSATATNAWLSLKPFSTFLAGKTVDIYVAVRVQRNESSHAKEDVFEVEIKNAAQIETQNSAKLHSASVANDDYQWLSLKGVSLTSQTTIDFKVFENPGVEKIYIDNVILVLR